MPGHMSWPVPVSRRYKRRGLQMFATLLMPPYAISQVLYPGMPGQMRESIQVGTASVDILPPSESERYLGRKLCIGDFHDMELANRVRSAWAAFTKLRQCSVLSTAFAPCSAQTIRRHGNSNSALRMRLLDDECGTNPQIEDGLEANVAKNCSNPTEAQRVLGRIHTKSDACCRGAL